MKTALAHGANFWNAGEFYGPPDANSCQLLKAYFEKYPEDADKVVLSIKGGLDVATLQADGSEEGVRRSVENTLKMLGGAKKVDIFECARVDPKVPIEDTMRFLGKLVEEGKIGSIGLSEVNAQTIRKAAAVTKIAGVEVELSMWETNCIDNGVAKTCAELGIPLIAYSPLGRGFLTGQIKKREDMPQVDMRRHFPRFSEENFPKNIELVNKLEVISKTKGCTMPQLALAWVRQLGKRPGMPTIIPIPGATTEERVNENFAHISLTDAEMKELDDVLSSFQVAGHRYPEAALSTLEQ
jgi:pyridoxine 4-dehydrogenase